MVQEQSNDERRAIVVIHPRLNASSPIVVQAISQLSHAGFSVTLNENSSEQPLGTCQYDTVPAKTEIVIVLGGDGTILRAAELVEGTSIPILGINMGHVGFLAEFESFQMSEAIKKIAARDYTIDQRTVASLTVSLPHSSQSIHDWALNDITVEKADRGKMIELGIEVDGVGVSSFAADGAIISTATGSTAYAFSAGGPIIWPNVAALQLVPLAAHALFARPLIIGHDSCFRIVVLPHSDSPGWITCDGRRSMELPRNSSIEVTTSKNTVRLARLSGVPFTQRLVTKFDLPVVGWREHEYGLTNQSHDVQNYGGDVNAA